MNPLGFIRFGLIKKYEIKAYFSVYFLIALSDNNRSLICLEANFLTPKFILYRFVRIRGSVLYVAFNYCILYTPCFWAFVTYLQSYLNRVLRDLSIIVRMCFSFFYMFFYSVTCRYTSLYCYFSSCFFCC